ncbi:MAG: fimbria/pilus outer membrane usher protein [Burkholderiaceae bacterium]|nr:fimbria/pilus outer membrane usher protein [Burkholderiaceae bacterium]
MLVSFPAAQRRVAAALFAALALALAGATAPARADYADNVIERISALQQSGGTSVRFTFSKPAAQMPVLLALDAPPRLVLDFAGMAVSRHRIEAFGAGLVETAAVVAVADRTRVVLTLRGPTRQVLRLQGGDLLLELAPADLGHADALLPAPAGTGSAKIAVAKGNHDGAGKKNNGNRPGAEMLLVELEVNGQSVPGIVRVERLADGTLALPLEAWQAARLRAVGAPLALPDGQRGYVLESVPELQYRVDRARLTLALTVPAGAFDSSAYSLGQARVSPPNVAPPGMYLNYSLAATHQEGGSSAYGGMLEGVVFNGWGSLVSGLAVSGNGHANNALRTDTYWRKDWPGSMETLVVGDAVGGSGGWSRPVRYGGVRYGRDFALAPGFITYPLPALSGSAALPSTVDVLVNNQRQASASVKTGPFALTNVPVVGGAGEINLVVRDLRGVETVITQGYYSSPRLLASGLSDFSAEAGALRRNYGSASNDYGAAFAAGSYQYGFNPGLTAGARAELQRTRQAGGLDATTLLGTFAVARAAAAWSRGSAEGSPEKRSGAHWLAAIERTSPRGGGALQWERFDAGFLQFGASAGEIQPRQRLQANAGIALGSGMSAGASYIRQTSWSGDRFILAGANLGIALPGNAQVSVFASRQLNAGKGWSAGLNLMVPLGNQRTLVATSNRDTAGTIANAVQASSSAPPGPGWGWSVRASDLASQQARAGMTLNTNYGQFTAEANAGQDANALRIGADGSLGWLEGLPFATRRIDQGAFAVVRVGAIAGVAVSRSNQVMATTNSRGLALVPGLLPYQTNVLTLNPDQLPFDINLGGVREEVVPYARSGVLVNFPVRRSRNVLAILRQASGVPVPPGARVTVSPGSQEFIVAKRGEVYLMDLQDDNRIEVRWKAGSCSLSLPLDPAQGGEAQVGPLICGGRP